MQSVKRLKIYRLVFKYVENKKKKKKDLIFVKKYTACFPNTIKKKHLQKKW